MLAVTLVLPRDMSQPYDTLAISRCLTVTGSGTFHSVVSSLRMAMEVATVRFFRTVAS